MEEFSLYALDITMNSVRAGASDIAIELKEDGEWLTFTVRDNGCGMTKEQLAKLENPFFTTRKTRNVGLGIPFLKMLAEQTGGYVKIDSVSELDSPDEHGTTIKAVFGKNHIDFIPLGDMIETVITLIQGNPEVNFTYTHETEGGKVHLSCEEMKSILGDGISLSDFEVLSWIREYLRESYLSIKK